MQFYRKERMSIRLRAMLYTLGIFVCIGVGSVCLVQILTMIPPEYYFPIYIAACIGIGFYIVYSFCVAQLEYRAKLEEIVNQK